MEYSGSVGTADADKRRLVEIDAVDAGWGEEPAEEESVDALDAGWGDTPDPALAGTTAAPRAARVERRQVQRKAPEPRLTPDQVAARNADLASRREAKKERARAAAAEKRQRQRAREEAAAAKRKSKRKKAARTDSANEQEEGIDDGDVAAPVKRSGPREGERARGSRGVARAAGLSRTNWVVIVAMALVAVLGTGVTLYLLRR
jgi:cobalamin biosynthesis Mg chelatase CobN